MNYTGKAHFSLIFTAPPELESEGDRLFSLHAAWMEETHHREGEKALLQYNVAKNSDDDGNIRFVIEQLVLFCRQNLEVIDEKGILAAVQREHITGFPIENLGSSPDASDHATEDEHH